MMLMDAQIKARQQAQQLQDALQDLHTWEKSIKVKDEALKRHKARQPPQNAPSNAATHTYDHYRDKWDAFDADAALASSNDDEPVKAPQTLLAPVHTRTLPPPAPTTALQWKEHGNTQFRNRRYAAAIESYTKSITLEPTCVAYANRAMAHLKLRHHEEAEQDAGKALELDDGYVKAWQRRAAARMALGRALPAAGDLQRAVLLAPDNRALVAEYRAAVEQLEACGALPPMPPIHLEVAVQGPEENPTKSIPLEGPPTPTVADTTLPTPTIVHETLPTPTVAEVHRSTPPPPASVPAPVSHQATALVKGALGPPSAKPAPVASVAPVARPAPKTGVEFETVWRSLKSDPAAKAALLLATPPTRLPALWKHSLSPDLLASVLCVLADRVAPDHPAHALSMLRALRDLPRIGVLVRLVPAAVVARVWDAMAALPSVSEAECTQALAVLGARPQRPRS